MTEILISATVTPDPAEDRIYVGLDTGAEDDGNRVASDVLVWDGLGRLVGAHEFFGMATESERGTTRAILAGDDVAYAEVYRVDWLAIKMRHAEDALYEATAAADEARAKVRKLEALLDAADAEAIG